MNFMKFLKILKASLVYLLIIILTLFLLEVISRIFVYIFSKEKQIFKFGLKNNIEFIVSSFSNLDFFVVDHMVFEKKNIKKKTENEIWVFGGSTSAIACRKVNETSWPNELNNMVKNYKIINFAKSGKSSDFSIKRLKSELIKDSPEIVVWAHFINEVDIVYFNKNKKINFQNNFLYFSHSLNLTLETKLVSYVLMKEFTKRLLWQLNINRDNRERRYSKLDYEFASKNYFNNTEEAINLSNKFKVKKFIILILPTKNSFDNKENSFLDYFLVPKIQELIQKYSIVYLNLDKLIRSNNDIKDKNYYCSPDRIHFTTNGNKFIARKMFSILKNK